MFHYVYHSERAEHVPILSTKKEESEIRYREPQELLSLEALITFVLTSPLISAKRNLMTSEWRRVSWWRNASDGCVRAYRAIISGNLRENVSKYHEFSSALMSRGFETKKRRVRWIKEKVSRREIFVVLCSFQSQYLLYDSQLLYASHVHQSKILCIVNEVQFRTDGERKRWAP